jgi:hypothetical protein
MVNCFSILCNKARASSKDRFVGGGVRSVVLIMAKPAHDGFLVTGKHADCVRVTGLGKLGDTGLVCDAEPGGGAKFAVEADRLDDPLPDGVIALEAPSCRRLLVEPEEQK